MKAIITFEKVAAFYVCLQPCLDNTQQCTIKKIVPCLKENIASETTPLPKRLLNHIYQSWAPQVFFKSAVRKAATEFQFS